MQTFKVLRAHQGDKDYAEGDTREANAAEVQHLVDNGVLEPVKAKAPTPKAEAPTEDAPAAKAEAPVLNKAEGPAPANKADTGARTTRAR